ncbi:hypothetical protein [Sinosporangium siamense]|uniref:Uncharacterized protein n=1 Tax=Sinosporangium siamense TaxID=1367973 RepID=A0A919VGY3_9ACTN|nr:hypothetical protein [Sinosporangium siamense]GII97564.1 hypothetical protein Ssi02_77950 [Sinosporangium siamense]
MPVTEFVGVTQDSHLGVNYKNGLYEFRTDVDAPVYLHDTTFHGLTYQPGRPCTMTMEFDYLPGWIPGALSPTPVVHFLFEDVQLVEWLEDQEGHDCVAAHPDAHPGQVDLFDWDGTDYFCLITFTLTLTFHARRVVVTVRPLRSAETVS